MPDDLRWSWCNNNRNKVHNQCDALESSWNHPPALAHGRLVFHKTSPWCQKGWGQSLYRVLIRTLLSAQSCPTLCNPMTVAQQASLSIEFPRQESWSGLACPPPWDHPNAGTKPSSFCVSCTGRWIFLPLHPLGSHFIYSYKNKMSFGRHGLMQSFSEPLLYHCGLWLWKKEWGRCRIYNVSRTLLTNVTAIYFHNNSGWAILHSVA